MTAPTAGVVTLAAMVAFDVLITRSKTTSGLDVSVDSVHVTITGPAARTASEDNVIMTEPAAYFEVDSVADFGSADERSYGINLCLHFDS